MFASLKSVRDIAGRGILAGAVLATALAQAPVSFAQAAPATVSWSPLVSPVGGPSGNNHAIGDVFNMAVVTTTSAAARGWQVNFTWNPAVVAVQDYQIGNLTSGQNPALVDPTTNATTTFGDTFLHAYGQAQSPKLGNSFNDTATINNTTGTLSAAVSDALTGGAALPGPTASSPAVMMIVQFKAVGNGTSNLTFVSGGTGTFLSNAQSQTIGTALTTGQIFVGAVPAAALQIQNATTVAAHTPADSAFNVTFNVTNTGNAALSTAVTNGATVTATNATGGPLSATINPLGTTSPGNTQAFTVGPFTLGSGQTSATVTISISCGTNSPCTAGPNQSTAYTFSAYTATGTTPVSATNQGVLQLTPPAAASLTLVPGTTATSTASNMTVLSNLTSFQVNISGSNNGFLTEANGTPPAFVTNPKQLLHQLAAAAVASPATGNTGMTSAQSITGTPALFVSGTLAGQNPTTGATFSTVFSQADGFNDPSVAAPHQYYEVVTFAAAGTF